MFRTAIKSLSLFTKVRSYNSTYSFIHSNLAFRKIEQPKLYNDALNMFMLSAFVKESIKNSNNSKEQNAVNERSERSERSDRSEDNNKDCVYCTTFLKREKELKFVCQITGCTKRENNVDCTCVDKCIVEKSEISIVSDLL
jgi:hypothetical protein